jgi:hypothetical protein
MQLNFEKLLKNYNEELVTKLRGFNEQEAFLQYWVPDSDKIISLFNLVDALYETKVFNFSIEILKKDKEIIDKLINEKEKIGNIKIEEKDNEYKVYFFLDEFNYHHEAKRKKNIKIKTSKKATDSSIKHLLDEKKNYDILISYQKNLDSYKFKYGEKKLTTKENLFSETVDKRNKIFIQIEAKNKRIINCWHDFSTINNRSILVDKFCHIILNKHIQEAAEHGLIYLEYAIRPNDIIKNIKGIILPNKIGGFFFDIDQCVKKIYAKIKKQYNFEDFINKEYFNSSDEWNALSHETKIKKLNKVLSEKIIPALKISNQDIAIHNIEFDTRIIIIISDGLEKKNHGDINYMMKIENFFKFYVDKRLELFITEKKDENKLRHLNSPQKI